MRSTSPFPMKHSNFLTQLSCLTIFSYNLTPNLLKKHPPVNNHSITAVQWYRHYHHTDVVALRISEWIAATPLVAWLPTIHRCAMLTLFSPPSSMMDMRRRRSLSPGHFFATSCTHTHTCFFYAVTGVWSSPPKQNLWDNWSRFLQTGCPSCWQTVSAYRALLAYQPIYRGSDY